MQPKKNRIQDSNSEYTIDQNTKPTPVWIRNNVVAISTIWQYDIEIDIYIFCYILCRVEVA
jgi:hypothetical protein